jgi:hypothetical protein
MTCWGEGLVRGTSDGVNFYNISKKWMAAAESSWIVAYNGPTFEAKCVTLFAHSKLRTALPGFLTLSLGPRATRPKIYLELS